MTLLKAYEHLFEMNQAYEQVARNLKAGRLSRQRKARERKDERGPSRAAQQGQGGETRAPGP